MSAKTETTENQLRRWLEHKVILIKVVGNIKTSLKIISAKNQLGKIAENGPKIVSNDEMVLMKVVQIE